MSERQELNARIARLLGWTIAPHPIPRTVVRPWVGPDGKQHWLPPDYSGDPAACAKLRQHLYRDGKYGSSIDFNMNLWEGLYRFRVKIEHDPIDGDCDEYEESGDTEEEACARACCAALEALTPQPPTAPPTKGEG